MALINCPECGKEVSDKAEKCPNCAHPINDFKPFVSDSKEGCFLQSMNLGCLLLFGIIGGITLLLIYILVFEN